MSSLKRNSREESVKYPHICDHTSVGMIAEDSEGRILMIERVKPPTGVAPPAGHCDGDSYPAACLKEFWEETGLKVVGAPRPIALANPMKKNRCRRIGGDYHFWQIFKVNREGDLKTNPEETKNPHWYSKEEIKVLARKAEEYQAKTKTAQSDQEREEIEKEWALSPGLEQVWYEFFKELKVI